MADAALMMKLFWRAGRKEFVEITATDAQRSMAAPPEITLPALQSMVDAGHVARSLVIVGGSATQTWYASKSGRSIIRRYIEDGKR